MSLNELVLPFADSSDELNSLLIRDVEELIKKPEYSKIKFKNPKVCSQGNIELMHLNETEADSSWVLDHHTAPSRDDEF